jgi:hypothetical protein
VFGAGGAICRTKKVRSWLPAGCAVFVLLTVQLQSPLASETHVFGVTKVVGVEVVELSKSCSVTPAWGRTVVAPDRSPPTFTVMTVWVGPGAGTACATTVPGGLVVVVVGDEVVVVLDVDVLVVASVVVVVEVVDVVVVVVCAPTVIGQMPRTSSGTTSTAASRGQIPEPRGRSLPPA